MVPGTAWKNTNTEKKFKRFHRRFHWCPVFFSQLQRQQFSGKIPRGCITQTKNKIKFIMIVSIKVRTIFALVIRRPYLRMALILLRTNQWYWCQRCALYVKLRWDALSPDWISAISYWKVQTIFFLIRKPTIKTFLSTRQYAGISMFRGATWRGQNTTQFRCDFPSSVPWLLKYRG